MPLQATSGAASYDAFGGGVPAVPNYIEEVFSTFAYAGSDSSQTLTDGINRTLGALDWFKVRSTAGENHILWDTIRTGGLETNTTASQAAVGRSKASYITQNDGNVVLNFGGNTVFNRAGENYIKWTFRKQPKFFDVLTYTGDGTSTRQISHSLASTPGCIIIKPTNISDAWYVWQRTLGNNGLLLNFSDAAGGYTFVSSVKNSNSTQMTVGNGGINDSGTTYVAYLFAHDAGGFGLTGTDNVISCGSFTLTGGEDIIDLGYEPQWLLTKRVNAASNWQLTDNMRGMTVSNSAAYLYPNLSNAETSGGFGLKPTATGISITAGSTGSPGDTFIYIAIRRGPMKVPTSGTSVFYPETRTGTGATKNVTGIGFAPDLVWPQRLETSESPIFDKLRGAGVFLNTSSTSAEQTHAPINTVTSFNQNGYSLGNDDWFSIVNNLNDTFATWNFKRAPSFFDEVCYTGTGSGTNQTISHNLGVTPQIVIMKARVADSGNSNGYWATAVTTAPSGQEAFYLNTSDYGQAYSIFGSGFAVTSTTFTTPIYWNTSAKTYVAYLFATCAGVSKVGSYTGTATTKQIDCGFTSGARFVLIKRTDSTGDWYVWDSARGIVSGNDPYILINVMSANITNTDYIDTYSAGFEISSTAPSAINASGGTFIFLAIA